jgi:hypothetical protein
MLMIAQFQVYKFGKSTQVLNNQNRVNHNVLFNNYQTFCITTVSSSMTFLLYTEISLPLRDTNVPVQERWYH